ncbi:MAG: hypothetical protein PHC50_06335 [Candidatus Cloacimonetes bacterium]|nr:hypothetical protein [Candidatus Cloacimonadota bacterium]
MKKLPLIITAILMIHTLLTAFTVSEDYAILSENECLELESMLTSEDFNLNHLKFQRDWDPYTRLKSKWHSEVLSGGLDALPKFAVLRELMAEPNFVPQMQHFFEISFGAAPPALTAQMRQEIASQAAKLKKAKDIFPYLERAFSSVDTSLQRAFENLDSAQYDTLRAFTLQSMVEDADSLAYQHYFRQQKLPWLKKIDMERIAKLFEKIDAKAMGTAALEYHEWALALQEALPKIDFKTKKALTYKSKWGLIIIGTKGNDYYGVKSFAELKKYPLCAVIDPAGNDTYEIAFSTSRQQPFYLLIDLKGDDLYRSAAISSEAPETKAPSFFGWGGLGYSFDAEGNDLYQLGDFSFAAMLGLMYHEDASGEDIYQGGLFSQAAALGGVALLIDKQGNDTYTAHTMSQAFGSVMGAGVLADYSGSDLYYLGGKYLHAPLMPKDYRSMGQGMGFGMRSSLAGGLGFLYDKSGNDKYIGGVYAQGVGYWFATGVLIDEGGNDVYNAIYYPQGSGIHCASGFLYDHEGDDTYYSRNGPGQGAGHDFSFGILVDAAGNDAYSIHGGSGLGLSNSLGIFVDKMGDDRYERQEEQNYGSGAFSRMTGSIGLFLDAGGKDLYNGSPMANDSSWAKGKYGFGKDMELNSPPDTAEKPSEEDLPAPSEDAPIKEIFAASAQWEVGNAIKRVRAAREIMLARTQEMIPYVLEHKLGSQSGLEYRALDALLKGSADFQTQLLAYAADSDSLKAKNAISLLAGVADMALLPIIQEHLSAGRYFTTCISALAALKSEEAVEALLPYRFAENEVYRFLVLRALSLHKSENAQKALEGAKADESFLIQALIRNLPKDEQ